MLDEFRLIQRFFNRSLSSEQCVLGIGDDAALIAPMPGMQLAISADTLVEGRHFFAGTDAYRLGWKSLAVNLSDMAAMGALPRWFTLCLTLPKADEAWLSGFAAGLFAAADEHDVVLIGGDTAAGPLTISIQIMGEVAPQQTLRRDAAQAGDDIWLSGCTGAAALAVRHRYGEITLDDVDLAYASQRLDVPRPQVGLGCALRGLAHAAIDVSDGLLADLGHIAARSKLAAQVNLASIPLPPLSAKALALPSFQTCLLAGGDDYELCFTAPASARSALLELSHHLNVPLSRIGTMVKGEGVSLHDANGQALPLDYLGFNHFN